MLTLLLALTLQDPAQPDPHVWYAQATACMGSSRAARPRDPGAQPTEVDEDALVWGLVMASAGPAAGRPAEPQQAADAAAAEAFFRQVRDFRPEAHQAHQTYCRALRP